MRIISPSHDNKELTKEMTHEATLDCLKEHMKLDVTGRKVTTEMILDVLIHAASLGQSIEASCAELESGDSNTIREYLNAAFQGEQLDELESQVNGALSAEIAQKVYGSKQEIAIDMHEQGFYGKDEELLKYASRGEAKAGTTYFYRIASVYLILKGMRITLGIVFVHSDKSLVDTVKTLVEHVKKKDIAIKCLHLDRGFANNAIYQYLFEQKIPSIIACPIRGKPNGKGTRALCKGRGSYMTNHNFHSAQYGDFDASLAVVRSFTHKGTRGQKKKRKARWFLYVLIHIKLLPQAIHARYRRRFGIESSYRLMRQLRIPSNSRNPAMRFLFMALGLILVNIWLQLRFRFSQIPKRGRAGRPLDEALFRLKRFASFLRHSIEQRYPFCSSISAHALPLGI